MKNNDIQKWNWKMNYCYNKGISPALSWAWNEAEEAYKKEMSKQN